MSNQQDDLSALLKDSGETTIEGAMAKAEAAVNSLDSVTLNIALTGESGAGKSSLINAMRGLQEPEEGSAPTDVNECTMVPTKYPHPTMPNVILWDLPGIGTGLFKPDNYLEKVKYQNYDFFIIVSASRFKANDLMLAKEIKEKKKNFYFVRSKTDNDVTQNERKGVKEEETLRKIRENCVANLKELGPPPVFLITANDLQRFDFEKLRDNLEKDLPENKRNVLLLSLPVYSKECLDQKYNAFKITAWAVAIASGAIATAPVPGMSLACDVTMVVAFLTKCYFSFGLNDESLQKISKLAGKPMLEIVRESLVVKALADDSLATTIATKLSAAGVAESMCSLVPGAGSTAAAGISFVTTRSVLLEMVKELYSEAKKVLEMAGVE